MKILVVDDDASVRKICERILAAAGHAVTLSESGAQAAPRLGEGWDLILTDMNMPGGIDGLELLRRAKQEIPGVDVIMISGAAEMSTAIGALKLGAYDFLLKPFTHDVITAAVKRCEDKRALSVELAREKELRSALARMEEVKDLFGRFVTPEVAESMLKLTPAQRRAGSRRNVTMLFADVRNFTAYAESVQPEVAVESLNALFAGLIDAIRREGGHLNKFMGDGLLALFGAPAELKEHEAAGARAALRARAFVRAFNKERESLKLPLLEVGIGVNSGPVMAGCLGTVERSEYTVIGHAVNLAARLESGASSNQILLGPGTAAALDGSFVHKSLGPVKLEGVSTPVPVSELISEKRA